MSANEIRRSGSLQTAAGEIRMRAELDYFDPSGWRGTVTYIGSKAALLETRCLTKGLLAARSRWRRGQYLRDAAGDRFGLQRETGSDRLRLILQWSITRPGMTSLFPEGEPPEPAIKQPHRYTATNLPQIARALERRYPGVRVHTESRAFPDGHVVLFLAFTAATADLLVSYGLAERVLDNHGEFEFKAVSNDSETAGFGSRSSDGDYHVYHFSDDGPPQVGAGRTFPLQKHQREFARIWKRISAPRTLPEQ